MSTSLSPENLNSLMSELTTSTLVGMASEMAHNGNYLMRWIEGNVTIEFAQNYRFLNPVTLDGYDITIMTAHTMHEYGWDDEPCELSLWLNDGENEEEWYRFVQDTEDRTYHPHEPLTENIGYQLITLLDNSELLDNLTPEDIAAPDGGHPGYFRRKHPD